jgi:hypothetical protein
LGHGAPVGEILTTKTQRHKVLKAGQKKKAFYPPIYANSREIGFELAKIRRFLRICFGVLCLCGEHYFSP